MSNVTVELSGLLDDESGSESNDAGNEVGDVGNGFNAGDDLDAGTDFDATNCFDAEDGFGAEVDAAGDDSDGNELDGNGPDAGNDSDSGDGFYSDDDGSDDVDSDDSDGEQRVLHEAPLPDDKLTFNDADSMYQHLYEHGFANGYVVFRKRTDRKRRSHAPMTVVCDRVKRRNYYRLKNPDELRIAYTRDCDCPFKISTQVKDGIYSFRVVNNSHNHMLDAYNLQGSRR
ncbi:hypothetical protein IWW38_000687, partial [Coemansia aciculifera]